MRWVYYAVQIVIIVGVFMFFVLEVFPEHPEDEPRGGVALIIGVFLALLVTAAIFWSIEGGKAFLRWHGIDVGPRAKIIPPKPAFDSLRPKRNARVGSDKRPSLDRRHRRGGPDGTVG